MVGFFLMHIVFILNSLICFAPRISIFLDFAVVLFSSLVLFSVCLNLLYITTRVSFVCFICLLLFSYPFFSIRGLNNLFCLSLFYCCYFFFLCVVNLFILTSKERQTTMNCGKEEGKTNYQHCSWRCKFYNLF